MVTDPNDLMPQLGVEAELTSRGLPNPATFSKDDLDEIIKIYEDDGSFDPTSDFARGLANYASSLYPEDPEWLSYEGLLTGRAGITKAFNDGNPLSVQGVIELLAQDTEGNRIVAPTLYGSETAGGIYQGVKDELIPAAGEAGGFAFGFKTVNDYFNKIKYEGSGKGWNKFLTRVGLPVIAGITTGVVGRNVAEKGQEFILGADIPILPQQRAAYAIGKGGTEGAYFSAMPYFMNKKISLGYELIKDNLITNRLNPLQKKAFEGSGLHTRGSRAALKAIDGLIAGMPTSVSKAPFMYGATEVGANIGTGLAQGSFVEDPDPYIGQLGKEMVYTFTGGYLGDLALRRGPTIANALKEGGIAATKYATSKDYRAQVRGLNKRALEGQVGAFLYKSLIEAGEDPEAVIKALTSKEFADLLDSDGSPVKPTAGTMSLSPTLLGIEGALQYLTTGLGAQRSANEDAVKEAIRNKIRGLYATGNRDALQESAAMMQGLFEASINKRVNEAVTNLDAAVQKIQTGPDGLPVPASRLEAEKLFDLLDKLMSADRDRERKLWQRIPRDVEISTFLDGQGNEIAVPNFISFWRNETKSTPEANVTTQKNFGDTINAFVERKTKELGIGEDVTSTAAPSKELQAANEKFNKLWTRVVSSETGRAEFETLLTQVQDLSPAEQATAFNVRAQEKGGKFSGKAGKAWAEAARAYADVITVQNALNTPPVAATPEPELIPGVNEIQIESLKSDLTEYRSGYENAKRNDRMLRHRTLNLDEKVNGVIASLKRSETAEEVDAATADFLEEFDDVDSIQSVARALEVVRGEAELFKTRLLPSTATPAAASEAAAEVATSTADVGTLSGKELFQMRSTALALGRKLDAGGDANGARLAHGFATALLDDLKSFPQGVNFAYDTARAYSVAFNNAYTKTFAGDLSATDKSGARKIAPELLKRELQGVDLAYLHVKQLDQVGQFQQQQLLSTLIDGSQLDAALRGNLFGAQTSDRPDVVKLREGFEGVIDPESEMLDLPKYEEWLKANKSLLDEVAPDLYEESIKVLGTANTVRGTTENVLRNIRENAIDETTGKVTPTSLAKWMQQDNNALMLKAFPALEADLSNMSRLNVLLDKTSAEAKQSINAVKAQSSFYQLMKSNGLDVGGTENPTTAINKALRPSNEKPIESLNRLFLAIGQLDVKNKPLGNLTVDPMRTEGVTTDLQRGAAEDVLGFDSALQGPTSVVKITEDAAGKKMVEPTGTTINREEALLGFRVSLIEEMLSKSGINANNGAFSATAAYKNFFEPLPNSQNNVSVAEWAESKGVMAAGQLDNMKKLLGEMAKYEQTLMSGDAQDFEDLVKKMGPGLDIALSILGSSAGTRARNVLVGPGGSGDLIVSGRAAEAARNAGRTLLEKAPEVARMTMLTKMFEDPELLGALLAKAKTPEKKASFALKAYNIMLDFLEPSSSAYRLVRPALVQDKPEEETSVITEKPDFLMGDRKRFTVTPERQQQMKQEFYERYVAPKEAEENVDELLQKAREFLDTREDASLQPLPRRDLPPSTQTAAPSGVQTASVDPAGSAAQRPQSGGISSIDINKARQLFPNDITFAARGGEMRSGIGGLFR